MRVGALLVKFLFLRTSLNFTQLHRSVVVKWQKIRAALDIFYELVQQHMFRQKARGCEGGEIHPRRGQIYRRCGVRRVSTVTALS